MFASKMHAMYTSHASAHTADAAFSCPRCASMDASSNIAMILDAILMASILFISLICAGNLVILRNVLVLLVVLAGCQICLFGITPKMRTRA